MKHPFGCRKSGRSEHGAGFACPRERLVAIFRVVALAPLLCLTFRQIMLLATLPARVKVVLHRNSTSLLIFCFCSLRESCCLFKMFSDQIGKVHLSSGYYRALYNNDGGIIEHSVSNKEVLNVENGALQNPLMLHGALH